ncbi:hypothetical protein HDV62DRAFT_276027 [Trichoderma sp. SZMC 28011]
MSKFMVCTLLFMLLQMCHSLISSFTNTHALIHCQAHASSHSSYKVTDRKTPSPISAGRHLHSSRRSLCVTNVSGAASSFWRDRLGGEFCGPS